MMDRPQNQLFGRLTQSMSSGKKITDLLDDPQNTLGVVFDVIMKDLGFGYTFKDCLSLARVILSKKNKISASMRSEIIRDSGGTCCICGRKAPDVPIEVDHIVPRSRGGLTEKRNLRVLCRDCNVGKSDKHFAVKG